MPTNYHVLAVTYNGPTNHRGSRFTIYSARFKQRVTVDLDHRYNSAMDQATQWLTSHGFELIGQGEGPAWDYLISSTFQPLKP